MDQELENGDGGVSLGYIFRVIFSQKWLVLIIAAAIALAGTLGIYFYGKTKTEYSVSFVLQLPNAGDATATTYNYPDGESFYFTDMVSLENLREVAKRPEFSGINVEDMAKGNAISITRTVDRLEKESTEGVYDLNYNIKVAASYFKDEEEAQRFIEAVASFPRDYISKMDINYDQSLTSSKSAITYSEKLSLLRSQAQYIQSKYGELVSAYGSEFLIADGRTLAQCRDEIDSYVNKDLFGVLSLRAEENGYIMTSDKTSQEKIKYESRKYELTNELKQAEATLQGLKEFQTGTGSIIYDEIISLNRQIASLKQNIEIIDRYISSFDDANKVAPADYVAEINKVEAQVTKFTEDIKPVALGVYGKVTKINYLSAKIVEAVGGYGILLSLAISVAVGILISMIVGYIVGINKLRKAEKTASVPVYGEARLQAAATDATEEKEDE